MTETWSASTCRRYHSTSLIVTLSRLLMALPGQLLPVTLPSLVHAHTLAPLIVERTYTFTPVVASLVMV